VLLAGASPLLMETSFRHFAGSGSAAQVPADAGKGISFFFLS